MPVTNSKYNEAGICVGDYVVIQAHPSQRHKDVVAEPERVTRVVRQGVFILLSGNEVFFFNEAVEVVSSGERL